MIDAAAILRYPLLTCTYKTLLGLLAVSGLRVGEAIRLDTSDIDWKRGLLIVRDTKFGKTRLVPLHPTATEALDDYLRLRGRLYPCPQPRTPAVFISAAGTRLLYNCVNFTFLKLARHAGLRHGHRRVGRGLTTSRHNADGGVMRPAGLFGLVRALPVVILSA